MIINSITEKSSHSGSSAVLFAMCLALMLSMFNSSMVGVLLPDIAKGLRISEISLQWVATIYTLAFSVILLPGAVIGRKYGRRFTVLLGTVIFIIGSTDCMISSNITILLLGRFIQAIGVGILLPQTLSVIVYEFEQPERRSKAVGLWAGIASVGLVAGPLIGGLTVSLSGWRLGFGVSTILALITLSISYKFLHKERHGTQCKDIKVDKIGAILNCLWLVSLVLTITVVSSQGWGSNLVLIGTILTIVFLSLFITSQNINRKGVNPLMPLYIWNNKGFIAANISGFLYFICLFGILYFYAQFFYRSFGYSPTQVGATFIPLTLCIGISSSLTGKLSGKFDVYTLLSIGLIFTSVSMFILGMTTTEVNFIETEISLCFVGIGCGILSATTSNGAVSSVDKNLSGIAAGIHTTCRQIGSTMGVALLSVIVYSSHINTLSKDDNFRLGLENAMISTGFALLISAICTYFLVASSIKKQG